MRLDSVKELLKEVNALISILEEQSQLTTSNKQKFHISGAKIKSIQEHLRSILEYIAQDIYDTLRIAYGEKGILVKEIKQLKFPIADSGTNFKKFTRQNFRYLDDLFPEIYTLIESIQPFKANGSWLSKLVDINNINKHNDLSEQEKFKATSVVRRVPGTNLEIFASNIGTGSFTILNSSLTIDGKKVLEDNDVIDFNNEEVIINSQNTDKYRIERKNIVAFKGDFISIVDQLKLQNKKISDFQDRFYRMLIDRIGR